MQKQQVCEQCGRSVDRVYPFDDHWRGEIALCSACFELRIQRAKQTKKSWLWKLIKKMRG